MFQSEMVARKFYRKKKFCKMVLGKKVCTPFYNTGLSLSTGWISCDISIIGIN